MAILNNIYPPIVDTYAKAFLADSGDNEKDTCKIYFSISNYNSIKDIKNAQVIISNQNNNLSILDETKYPCEIMLTDIYEDLTKMSNDKYYIKIKKSDIQDGNFEINQYYKVQIRFTSKNAENVSLTLPQKIDSWLSNNLSYFSEWSTVVLIRAISTPILTIKGFENNVKTNLWLADNVDIIGRLSFKNEEEKETLTSYQIFLYNNEKLITDSGILYSGYYSGINEINYTFKYNFLDKEQYKIKIHYTTEDLYEDELEYDLTIIENNKEILDATLEVEANEEEGVNILSVIGNDLSINFTGNLTIRRASSETNFTVWEDLYTIGIENKKLNFTWIDYCIKSGIWYKYGIQKRDSLGNRGKLLISNTPIMSVFEDIFLVGQERQLKIKFNPQIQSMQNVVAENKIDTIGSKYPYINRNGNMNYRQFPLSGTISFFMDKENFFTSREKIYGENLYLYNEYNEEKNINPFIDITYERDFREEVKDFLNDNNVKLFKSAEEGNILVKLMNVSFTPENALGRQIYNFSCTAFEIDNCSIDNYNKYNIQKIGELDTYLSYQKDYLTQYNKKIPKDTNVIELLNNYYKRYGKKGYTTLIDHLDYLKIEMEDKPYLIGENDGEPYIVDEVENEKDYIMGYLVYINEKPIIINPEGIYELSGNNVEITSIVFPKQTNAVLDVHSIVNQSEDLSQLIKTANYFKKIGQRWGSFKYEDSIYQQIWNKYFQKYSSYYQSIVSLDRVKIDTSPGTVVYLKEKNENIFQRHVIGQTGTLDFYNENSNIEGLYFLGIHLDEANLSEQERINIPDGKFYDTEILLDNFDENKNLINNGVYILSQEYLKAYEQYTGEYVLKVTSEQKPDTEIVYEDRINEEDGKKNLLVTPMKGYIDNDGTVIIDEEDIVLLSHTDTGNLYIEGKDKPIINNQVSVKEEDLQQTIYNETMEPALQAREENGNIVVKERDIDNNSSMVLRKVIEEQPTYEITLNKEYDNIFALILNKDMRDAKKYIWYHGKWYLFTDTHDIICSVEALIDYECSIVKGNYA